MPALLVTAAPLLVALLAGVIAGLLRLFPDPDGAVAALNRFCLYLAFPALIFANVYEARLGQLAAPGFVAATILPTLILIAAIGLLSRGPAKRGRLRSDDRAAMGLGAGLGNIAYLGIPLSASVLGPQVIGLASLCAALHIVVTIPLGTWTLLRWSDAGANDEGKNGGALARTLRQPLVWAPILGLLARALPEVVVAPVLGPCAWIGGAASPVALFVIGLYLHTHHRELLRLRLPDLAVIGGKLLVLPALTLGCALLLRGRGWLDLEAAQVAVVQATMPTAITTFALAEAYGIGRAAMVRTIVGSTVLFMISFAVLAPALLRLL